MTRQIINDANTYKRQGAANEIVSVRSNAINLPSLEKGKHDKDAAIGCINPSKMLRLKRRHNVVIKSSNCATIIPLNNPPS